MILSFLLSYVIELSLVTPPFLSNIFVSILFCPLGLTQIEELEKELEDTKKKSADLSSRLESQKKLKLLKQCG